MGLGPAQELGSARAQDKLQAIETALAATGADLSALQELDELLGVLVDEAVSNSAAVTQVVIDDLAWALVMRERALPDSTNLADEVVELALSGSHEVCARLALAISDQLQRLLEFEQAVGVLRAAGGSCKDSRAGGRVRIWATVAQLERLLGRYAPSSDALLEADAALSDVADGGIRAMLRCEIIGRRIELLLAFGLPDQAIGLLAEEQLLADQLNKVEYQGAAQLHKLDVWTGLQRYQFVVEAAAQELGCYPEPFDRLIRLRGALALSELAKLFPDEYLQAAMENLHEVLALHSLARLDRIQAASRLVDLEWTTGNKESAQLRLQEIDLNLGALPVVPLDLSLYVAELHARFALDLGVDRAWIADSQSVLRAHYFELLEQWSRTEKRGGGVAFLHYGVRRRMLVTLMRGAEYGAQDGAGISAALKLLWEVQKAGTLARFTATRERSFVEDLGLLTAEGHSLLTFLPDRRELHIYVVDSKHSAHIAAAWPASLEAARRELEGLCSALGQGLAENDIERMDAYAQVLADVLLPEAVRMHLISTKHLHIIAGDLLGYVPFEFLPYAGARLGERLAVTNLPTLPLAGVLDERLPKARLQSSPALHVLVAPTSSSAALSRWPKLGTLPFGPAENRLLLRNLPVEQSCLHVGASAQLSALSASVLGEASALAFIGHGVHDYRLERSAALVLAPTSDTDEGLLSCDDVEKLRVPPLVFVAACGAGRGVARYGEDLLSHLGGAFLSSGAATVVLSSHDLDYHLALALANHFFSALYAKHSSAEAMREARVALAAGDQYAARSAALVRVIGLGAKNPF